MTESELARRCGVDPKTVSRWVADDARVPRPRLRWKASEALGKDESVLWPDAVKSAIKTGPDREVQAVYPYRSACPRSAWRKLITASRERLFFAGYTSYFLWLEHPNLGAALRRKAQAGCQVRFVLGDPSSPVTAHREAVEATSLTLSTRIRVTLSELEGLGKDSGVEYRFSDDHVALSVWLFDDEALVAPHLTDAAGHESPLLHLQRQQEDGLFDRFAGHAEWLWEHARNPG